MLAIRIDLLTGRYAATAYNDRDQVEWPPHPARLFSALVATWAEGAIPTVEGSARAEPEAQPAAKDAELAALRWLEAQPAPIIVASPVAAAGVRTPAVVFVPVNDVGVIKAPDASKLDDAERALAEADPAARPKAEKQVVALQAKLAAETLKATATPTKFGKHDAVAADQVLLERRARQPRTFPCAIPEVPAFAFVWRDLEVPANIMAGLSSLAQRLVRLGHSTSLVHARAGASPALAELDRAIRFVPDEQAGDQIIRWVGDGQVDRLIRAHAHHQQVEPRVLPARFVRYREGERRLATAPPTPVFDDDWIVYARLDGPRLPITSAAGLARQFRRALMSVAEEPIPDLLSGHRTDGSPSEAPHLAIVPLPFVMGPHPDGALLGIAVVLPRAADAESRRAVMHALDRLERASRVPAVDGAPTVTVQLDAGELALTRVVWGEHPRATLRPLRWTAAARHWASATPIALDRNPGDLHDADPPARARAFDAARASVLEAIARIGLPAPTEVDVVRSCVLPGTAKPRAFPRFPSHPRKPQRVLVHVRLVFAEPIRGPVLLGAGRYQGLGLCAPVDGAEKEPA